MSLDGFVNDRNGTMNALYPDYETLRNSELMQGYIRTTGSVVMGRRAFAMAKDPDWYAGNYEFQVPIFVVTHETPKKQPRETDKLTFTFVTDGIASAISKAKVAAGDEDVMVVGGADTAQQCIRAGVVDELHIGIMPVLLCNGLRLFEGLDAEQLRLERLTLKDLPAGRTHLRFRVAR